MVLPDRDPALQWDSPLAPSDECADATEPATRASHHEDDLVRLYFGQIGRRKTI